MEEKREGEKETDFEKIQRKGGKLHRKQSLVGTFMSGIGGSGFHRYPLYFCSVWLWNIKYSMI